MNPHKTASELINSLSADDDTRQNLWVEYLDGVPLDSLENRLSEIKADNLVDVELQRAIWNLINNPPTEKLAILLERHFSEYERSIICCLMLGLSSSDIAEIKGISRVRIKQTIAAIRYNGCWEEFYGIKEESNR